MNAALNLALVEAMRMSEARAIERPAPAAAPLTAAMTGVVSLRRARETPDHVSWPRRNSAGDMDEQGVDRLEVEPPTEPAAGAGEHHDPDGRVVLDLVAELGERVEHLEGERVELVRPVERDQEDPLFGPLDGDPGPLAHPCLHQASPGPTRPRVRSG